MRLWLHLNLRRPQPFFTPVLQSSRTREFSHSRIPALVNSSENRSIFRGSRY